MTVSHESDLWDLVRGQPQVDPMRLALAIQHEVEQDHLDFRTRLLIRDSLEALKQNWGPDRLKDWLANNRTREKLEAIWREDLGAPGFPSLAGRIMAQTDPQDVRQFLRELGTHVTHPLHMHVGGSAALLLPGYVARATEDIDVVDEVPDAIRSQHDLLQQLNQRYGLRLTHFQSHYLPTGWQERVHSLEPFGMLQVYLVDVYDIFMSKLFSTREKDLDDLRALSPQLEKEVLIRRLRETTTSLRTEAKLAQAAEKNWYVLYGEALPRN